MLFNSRFITSAFAISSFCLGSLARFDSSEVSKLSLDYPYIDEGFQITNWDFGGSAIVDTSIGVLLTPDLPHRRGHLWSTRTLPKDNWIVEFDFLIGGKKVDYLFGDGFAFWATAERATGGPVFGSRDYFNGLGVFFDTYKNGRHDKKIPLVVGMLGDGKTPYDNQSDGLSSSFASCSNYEYRGQVNPVKCRVKFSIEGSTYLDCFTAHNITLPEDVYLGFTALTGELSDVHQISRIETNTFDSSDAEKMTGFKAPEPQVTVSNNSNFTSSFVKLLLVSGVFAAAFYGYKLYASKSSKRF
ncbi:hypothetical protein BB561_003893 [Smittium simulii]|uniref:L-type lectin-like domain-containing protein n=1 Tax=Smittium simulii TaxID=133385 RepID=A0A2T9YJ07_9FUNG|nr:hypothetical protein BB561_003893 [Smittium simulii]